MKKAFYLCLLWFCAGFTQNVVAQKIGYIDTQAILVKMPGYAEAEQQLEKLSKGWESEIIAKKAELDQLLRDYQAEELLLTPEMREQRKAAITAKENELRDFQNRTFGYQGMLFLKRQELIAPVQDEVYRAVKKVAKKKRLAIVFDKAGDLVMIYTDPIHDYTDYVLEELGLGDPADNGTGK